MDERVENLILGGGEAGKNIAWLLGHEGRQVVRPLAGESARVAPDGSPDGGEDDGSGHEAKAILRTASCAARS